jgi:hypothetical protein
MQQERQHEIQKSADIHMNKVSIESLYPIDYEYRIYRVAHIRASILHGSKHSRTPAWDSKLHIITWKFRIRLRTSKDSRFSCTENVDTYLNKVSV